MGEPQKSKSRVLMSRSEYARYLGVTPGRISQMMAEGKLLRCVVRRGHKVYIDQAIADAEARGTTQTRITLSDDGGDYQSARTEKIRAEAQAAKIRLAKMRGELISVDEVTELCSSVFSVLRQRLDVLADRIGPELAAEEGEREVRERLRSEIRAALTDAASVISNG